MKNKRYRVWMPQGYTVDIEAQHVETILSDDKPMRIRFMGENDYKLAEFFCDMISGWAEVDCITITSKVVMQKVR